jgi:TPP-dependent pyruvate/acetoin dehydrogenase alpha subunit
MIATDLYTQVVRIRMIEEAIATRYAEQKMRCPVHLSIGQEALAVGVCQAARPTDYAVSGHRAHAHYLAKGGSLKAMIAEIYGKKTGCCGGRGGSMHLIDLSAGFLGSTPIVGGSIPVGVGSAFASKFKNEANVTLVFLGEGSTEEGVFMESLNFAALHKLPVLFICENNFYSVYSPLNVRQDRDRVAIAKAHNIYTDSGDGNNVVEVYEKTKKALQNTPAFIEFTTYRHREHCGPNFDNNIGYRTEEEFLHWKAKDPVPALLESVDTAAIQQEIDDAFKFAEESPYA